jgi:hypothetical protein
MSKRGVSDIDFDRATFKLDTQIKNLSDRIDKIGLEQGIFKKCPECEICFVKAEKFCFKCQSLFNDLNKNNKFLSIGDQFMSKRIELRVVISRTWTGEQNKYKIQKRIWWRLWKTIRVFRVGNFDKAVEYLNNFPESEIVLKKAEFAKKEEKRKNPYNAHRIIVVDKATEEDLKGALSILEKENK